MGVIFVARSAKFGKWASDVGLSKNVFKVGYAEEDPKAIVEKGWGGETDWTLVRKRDADGLSEAELVARLARKEKMVDPNYYPRLRGATGIFKVSPVMGGGSERLELKLKPTDFADYLIHNALG